MLKIFTHTHIYIYIYMYVYLQYYMHLIFPTLEEEEVLFIYSFPLIYWFSNRWREKVMDRIHLDSWG